MGIVGDYSLGDYSLGDYSMGDYSLGQPILDLVTHLLSGGLLSRATDFGSAKALGSLRWALGVYSGLWEATRESTLLGNRFWI